MKIKKIIIFSSVLIFSSLFILQSCKKEEEGEEGEGNETKISKYFDNESHNMGQNCMNCHKSGGSGEGWFNVAGTVYDSLQTSILPNTTVRLYTGANGTGTLKATIEVDGKGNFYTTSKINFGSGLYPSVQGNSKIKYMGSKITAGQCNGCHGSSTGKIWTK